MYFGFRHESGDGSGMMFPDPTGPESTPLENNFHPRVPGNFPSYYFSVESGRFCALASFLSAIKPR
jgi:hypothetical protein